MKKFIFPTLFTVLSMNAFADTSIRHGYITQPPSRAFLCSSEGGNKNKSCGPVQYEPQSVEGPKGFPSSGPQDGKLASGGNLRFDELNQQSPTRWKKINVKSGENKISWRITARHSTTSWKYFITKQNWNPNKPLERADFDLKPFCEKFDHGKVPTDQVHINCTIPERNGYQVILGVWDIADTGNAFYQVIDANMSSTR